MIRRQQKARRQQIRRAICKHLQAYGVSMNQIPSHSQMPAFNTKKSQTTAILHQEPTFEEMYGKSANILANLFAFLLIAITVLALSYMYQSSSEKEIQHQMAQELVRQAEYK